MTTIRDELRASYAFAERNFFLTRRTWAWEVAFLVYSVDQCPVDHAHRGRPAER